MRPPDDDAAGDGLPTPPSTRRDASGSPAPAPSRAAGEPTLSASGQARIDGVFAELQARIADLWDADRDLEEIRRQLTKAPSR